eukprot:maker-scaffold192_size271026-snap-gene-1.21 protein:Tk07204 transcript:maker-scaffold192_size271026-snap-gene-1.21-mRNA-1 annotation:"gustatory receptor trehalose 1"
MANSTMEQCQPEDFVFSSGDSMAAGIGASICAVLGSLMNFSTVVALLRYPKTRSHGTTPFVVSLACSDFIFSFLTLPSLAVKFFAREWIMGETWCYIYPMLFYSNSAITLLSLIGVTLNRWVLINWPSKSDKIFSRNQSKLMILACWICPFIMMLPSYFGIFGVHGLDCRSRNCTIKRDENGYSPKIIFLLVGLVVPCVVLVTANILIYMKVHVMRQKMEEQLQNRTALPKGMKQREQRLTKMMLFIFGCFLLTYLPGVGIKVMDKSLHYPSLHVASYIVNWLSVIMNPTIYVATQERYRQAFQYLFGVIIPSQRTPTERVRMNRTSRRRSSVSDTDYA